MAGRSYVYNVARNLDLSSSGNGLDADGNPPACLVMPCHKLSCHIMSSLFFLAYVTFFTFEITVTVCSIKFRSVLSHTVLINWISYILPWIAHRQEWSCTAPPWRRGSLTGQYRCWGETDMWGSTRCEMMLCLKTNLTIWCVHTICVWNIFEVVHSSSISIATRCTRAWKCMSVTLTYLLCCVLSTR